MIKLMTLIFLFLLSRLSIAQTYDMAQPLTPNELWRQDGQLVTVQVSKKSPIRIFVVGREEAKINPSNLKITVRRMQPYPGKELHVDKYNNYYVIANPKEAKDVTDLEIVTHVKNQKNETKDETFHFNLNQKAP